MNLHRPNAAAVEPSWRVFGFCLCICLGILVGNAIMPIPGDEGVHLRNVSEDGQFNRIRRFLHGDPTQRAAEIGKNHQLVKAAFRDVVKPSISSTVQVRVEGRQVALGMVVDRLGHILTKASELDGPVRCKTPGGNTFKAEIVGVDQSLDLALLRTSRTDLAPVTFAGQTPPLGSWLAVSQSPRRRPVTGRRDQQSHSRNTAPTWIPGGVARRETSQGSRIDHVLHESSAEKFGLLAGDIIYAVDGRTHSRSAETDRNRATIPAGSERRIRHPPRWEAHHASGHSDSRGRSCSRRRRFATTRRWTAEPQTIWVFPGAATRLPLATESVRRAVGRFGRQRGGRQYRSSRAGGILCDPERAGAGQLAAFEGG